MFLVLFHSAVHHKFAETRRKEERTVSVYDPIAHRTAHYDTHFRERTRGVRACLSAKNICGAGDVRHFGVHSSNLVHFGHLGLRGELYVGRGPRANLGRNNWVSLV
jgi:hypothetical protein